MDKLETAITLYLATLTGESMTSDERPAHGGGPGLHQQYRPRGRHHPQQLVEPGHRACANRAGRWRRNSANSWMSPWGICSTNERRAAALFVNADLRQARALAGEGKASARWKSRPRKPSAENQIRPGRGSGNRPVVPGHPARREGREFLPELGRLPAPWLAQEANCCPAACARIGELTARCTADALLLRRRPASAAAVLLGRRRPAWAPTSWLGAGGLAPGTGALLREPRLLQIPSEPGRASSLPAVLRHPVRCSWDGSPPRKAWPESGYTTIFGRLRVFVALAARRFFMVSTSSSGMLVSWAPCTAQHADHAAPWSRPRHCA